MLGARAGEGAGAAWWGRREAALGRRPGQNEQGLREGLGVHAGVEGLRVVGQRQEQEEGEVVGPCRCCQRCCRGWEG